MMNMRLRIPILKFVFFIVLFFLLPNVRAAGGDWQKLENGLYIGTFEPKKRSKIYHEKIVVLKIDPKVLSLKLGLASAHGRKLRTAKQWCTEFGLLAAINASMYQSSDFLKSTGYMRNYDHVNNAHIHKDYGALLLFNPIEVSLPEVQMVDRRVQKNWKSLMRKYHSVVQNYRMISNGRKAVWPKRIVMHRIAAVGMDQEDHVLFILSRALYSTHDFINVLLSLQIGIKSAMYVEGGPEATLYLNLDRDGTQPAKGPGGNLTRHIDESPSSLPNVIGIMRRR
jgi:hypothetical protein